MAAHAPWSREEVSLLLRAWVDAVESRPRNSSRATFLRYQALYNASACGGEGGVSSRAEPSVFIKRKTLQNMHAVVSLFLASITAASGRDKEEEQQASYCRSSDTLRAWFGMSEAKRRRWFNDHNKKSYLYTEMTEEQFAMITEILAKSSGGVLPPPPVYVKPDAKIAKPESKPESIAAPTLSDKELTAAMVHASESFRIVMERLMSGKRFEATSTKEEGDSIVAATVVEEEDDEEPTVAVPPLPQPPHFQIGNPVIEENGSDTESDGDWEEIVPPSPIREADDGSDVINTAVGSLKRKLDSPTSDAQPRELVYPDKRSQPAHPEILSLLNALEKQARDLNEAFRNTKLARRRDQVERQRILRLMRQEQSERQKILEGLRRQEEEARLQRIAWRREQDEMMREFAQDLPSPPP